MCLRFALLLIARMVAWLPLSRREDAWKAAEILLLHHQLAVLQRQAQRPRPDWADRALLAVLPGLIPDVPPQRAAPARHSGHDPALAP